jgi:hypothetical protein
MSPDDVRSPMPNVRCGDLVKAGTPILGSDLMLAAVMPLAYADANHIKPWALEAMESAALALVPSLRGN